MNEKKVVWGISKWRDWCSCPAAFHSKHIEKTWIDLPSPALERGRKIHTAFEEGIKYDIPLAAEDEPALADWEGVRAHLVELKAQGHSVIPEHKFGVDRYYRQTDYWRGADLWIRVGLDVFADLGDKIKIADWKTGRYKTEHREDAMFYGAAVQHCYQKPVEVDYFFVDNPAASFSLPVKDGHKILAAWMKKFSTADAAIMGGCFDLTPGPQCRWCGNKTCFENKNEKLK